MSDVSIRDGRKFLQVKVEHSRFNEIQFIGSRRKLLMVATDLISGIYDTLPYWDKVVLPSAFKSLYDIMKDCDFSEEISQDLRNRQSHNPLIFEIDLGDESIIQSHYHGHNVWIPIEPFIVAVLNFLADKDNRRFISIEGFLYDFQQDFNKRWHDVLEKAKESENQFNSTVGYEHKRSSVNPNENILCAYD